MPDQAGRTVLVTGSTGGLGHHVSLELARRGARVVLASRNQAKLEQQRVLLRAEAPQAELDVLVLDLSDQARVRRAADLARQLGPIDVLVNNAGVMAVPQERTVDGLDRQLATNHFGPFLFTGLLLPQLVESGDGRVVTVSSLLHRYAGRAPLDEPRQPPPRYARWGVYSRSKLANLLFTFELEKRLRRKNLPVHAMAAHPGYAATNLYSHGPTGRHDGAKVALLNATIRATTQRAAIGALPILMAATAELPGGSYCGPSGFQQLRGRPRLVGCTALARDAEAQRRLWEISEHTVGLIWP